MSNEMNSDYCYIARTTKPIERFPNAGTIVAIVVDAPMFARQTAKDVAGYIRMGFSVERVPTDWAMEHARTADKYIPAPEGVK